LADLTDPRAGHQFGHPSHLPWNPHAVSYPACQAIATGLRRHATPRPEGVLAPSVRTPAVLAYRPCQIALFVLNAPEIVTRSLTERAALFDQWNVEIEFVSVTRQETVSVSDQEVAWSVPRVKLSGNSKSVPRYAPRSTSKSIPVDKWQPLRIQYFSEYPEGTS
jgi:hypothetical protein